MDNNKYITGNIIDVFNKRIFQGEIVIENGFIKSITEKSVQSCLFISPGLIDAHIHIESSMLTPQNFSEVVVRHGTVALIADPHEIANVLGVEGILYMITNAEQSAVKFFFGAPSCVPATSFECSGAEISPGEIEYLFETKQACFLSEMMNYPGVISNDPIVMKKIAIAKKYNLRIDGHAPGLKGNDLKRYVKAGVETDHECVSLIEAVGKIKAGMKILIREGSAAKNFNALFPLIDKYPESVMFCSDDLHPDDLIKGHINLIVKRAINCKADIFNVFRACTLNPVMHYNIPAGLLRVGDPADITVFDNLSDLNVVKTICNGITVFEEEQNLFTAGKQIVVNNFNAQKININSLKIPDINRKIKIIQAIDGELLTKTIVGKPLSVNNELHSDVNKDYLKMTVLNRYKSKIPALGFINGFGMKRGAIASSVAHDSHNIIAIGTDDLNLREIINWIIMNRGGVAVHDGVNVYGIPLPIAGIISDDKAEVVAEKYAKMNDIMRTLGCKLTSPFMTLSFMALLVIPEIKLSDEGLFESKTFSLVDLYIQ